ncbi:MAG: WG repeat-containing protein [Moraxella sp.]|nr:WG repeat-containing protein [Moraxella sp.]
MKFLLLLGLILCVNAAYAAAYACTTPKSYYKNVSCTSAGGVYLAVKDNGSPVALLDKNGKQTADLFAYSAVLPKSMAHGLLPVRKGDKIGYINSRGKVVIALRYDSLGGSAWARPVANGRIVVQQDGRLGVIDTAGKVIVAFSHEYRSISDFRGDRATVVTSNATYQIDKQGRRLTKETASNTNTADKPSVPIFYPLFYPEYQNGKWGFVDNKGVLMITHSFKEVRPYSESLAAVKENELWGFIDLAGNLVIEFRFDDAGLIHESKHAPKLDTPLMFIDGKAWIGNLHDGTKLCIDRQGNNVNCE